MEDVECQGQSCEICEQIEEEICNEFATDIPAQVDNFSTCLDLSLKASHWHRRKEMLRMKGEA